MGFTYSLDAFKEPTGQPHIFQGVRTMASCRVSDLRRRESFDSGSAKDTCGQQGTTVTGWPHFFGTLDMTETHASVSRKLATLKGNLGIPNHVAVIFPRFYRISHDFPMARSGGC